MRRLSKPRSYTSWADSDMEKSERDSGHDSAAIAPRPANEMIE